MLVTVPLGRLLRTEDSGFTYTLRCPPGSCYTSTADYPAPRLPLTVKYEDEAVIVVDKPAMLPTENTRHIKDSVRARLEAILRARGDEAAADELRVPHRLDWETSGLLVLARTSETMRSLAKQFAANEVEKVYIADVLGAGPPAAAGTVNLPLAADLERLPRQKVDFVHGKAAVTDWELEAQVPEQSPGVERDRDVALHAWRLRLRPHSGRRHQLRLHMASLGAPIARDSLYGNLPTEDIEVTYDASSCGHGQGRGLAEQFHSDAALCSGQGATDGQGGRSGSESNGHFMHDHDSNITHDHHCSLHLHAAELAFTHPSSCQRMRFRSEPPFRLEDAALSRASCCWVP